VRSAFPKGWRVPANDLEQLVITRVRRFLTDEATLFAALRKAVPDVAERRAILDRAASLSREWPKLAVSEARRILIGLLTRVSWHADRIDLHVLPERLPKVLGNGSGEASLYPQPDEMAERPLVLSVPVSLRRAGKEMAMVIGAEPTAKPTADPAMLRLILRARNMWSQVQRGEVAGLGDLAAQEGVSGSYTTRVIRLAFLAPDVLAAIIEGQQPADLTAARLLQECRRGLSLDWQQQRDALGFS